VNQLDALLLLLLVPFTLRGWWRGFCRESLALVGLFGGVLAAVAGSPALAKLLLAQHVVPAVAAHAVAWVAIFLGTWVAAALLGLITDRLARALFLGGFNRLAGAAFGLMKGAAILGFALLLAEQVAPSPSLTKVIAASRLGRPLEQIAGSVVERGRELGTGSAERHA
jgi:membrane protein required for colicin V production